ISFDDQAVMKVLVAQGLGSKESPGKDVFFNGRFVGTTSNPADFTKKVRKARRAGELPREMSVKYDYILDQVSMSTEVGRVLRAVIVVENGASLLKDEHLLLLEQNKLA